MGMVVVCGCVVACWSWWRYAHTYVYTHDAQVDMVDGDIIDDCVEIMRIPTGLAMWRSRAEVVVVIVIL